MDQVGSVCACSRSQSLALPGEKALPVGYPDGRDSRICNRKLFGGAVMQRRTAVTMRQDADVSQQHFAPISQLKRNVAATHRRLVSWRSEEHTSELQSHLNILCRLLLDKKKR